MLGLLLKAPIKIIMTAVVSILLFVLMFAFTPDLFVRLQDGAEWIDNQIRNPPLDEQGTVLFRQFVNENSILAIFGTLVARSIVEGAAQIGGMIFGFER